LLNLTNLLQEQNYGVAGMFERANIIDAKLQLDSTPGCGTTVTLKWFKPV
jgi:signal transduction histidine kinase